MRGFVVLLGLVLGSLAAFAQTPRPADPDLAYCEQLFEMHERYVVRLRPGGTPGRDPMADLAIDRCRHGRYGEGIPVLEAKLAGARIPLPTR